MLKTRNSLLGLISALLISGCGGGLLDAIDKCGTDIKTLKSQNSISAECKESIQDLLPEAQNNIKNTVLSIGRDGNTLFVLGATSSGDSIDLKSTNLTIDMHANGSTTRLNSPDYSIKSISDMDASLKPFISISSILDYSSSMSDGDIDDAASIYKDIYKIFVTPIIESEIRLFSQTVYPKLDFTTNSSTLITNISRDKDFERSSTALYDAMGSGFEALSHRTAIIKLMILSTDGMENNSTKYKTEQSLYDMSHKHHIPVILLGSLFSDITFMKDMASETKGLFVYTKTLIAMKKQAIMVWDLIKNIQVIEITKSTTAGSTFTVNIDGKEIDF